MTLRRNVISIWAGTTCSILDFFVDLGMTALPIAGGLGPLPGVSEVFDDMASHAARDRCLSRDPDEAFARWQRVVGKRLAQQRGVVRRAVSRDPVRRPDCLGREIVDFTRLPQREGGHGNAGAKLF